MGAKPKRISKRAAAKRLNDEGRQSPLEVFQLRMEFYAQLATEEIKKGELGSSVLIGEYLKLAQEAGEALAPYRHPKLQAADLTITQTTKVIRAPTLSTSNDEWLRQYAVDDSATPERALEFMDQLARVNEKLN